MKRSVFNLVSALFFLALQIPTSIAASFDCTKAGTQVEKLICSTAVLGELDVALSTNYKNIRASNIGDSAGADLLQTQREWMRQRNTCSSADCIERIYRKRLDEICSYPVLSGIHPPCKYSAEIGNKPTANNQPKPKTFATSVTADVMQGLEQSSESQKFKDIGVCFGSIYQGMVVTIARPAGEIFLEQSRKLGAIVDMDKVKNSAINILTKACPTRSQDCIDQRVPKNTIGFLVGYDSALNNIQRRSQSPGFSPMEIMQVQQQFCKKYFNY